MSTRPLPTLEGVTSPPHAGARAPATVLDPESREWLRCLRADDGDRDPCIARLHALLLRAARFEVARRQATLPHLRGDELDDIAHEAADDALMSVLRRLDDFRGDSRFTTWAYKFALLEAAGEAAQARLAGPRAAARAGGVGAVRERELAARRRAEQAELLVGACDADRRGADAAPAPRARRAGRERRPDRRARRAPQHDARRALQDTARRPAQAARAPRAARDFLTAEGGAT